MGFCSVSTVDVPLRTIPVFTYQSLSRPLDCEHCHAAQYGLTTEDLVAYDSAWCIQFRMFQ
jgi:hypothetical protein